jgi:hypothetical protein
LLPAGSKTTETPVLPGFFRDRRGSRADASTALEKKVEKKSILLALSVDFIRMKKP